MSKSIFILTICLAISFLLNAQEKSKNTDFLFKGQLSGWSHFNANNSYPLYLGCRYIPQANYKITFQNDKLIDFEASANLYGQSGIHFFDSINLSSNAQIYRMWARYSTKQLEFRVGLQKIDFGTATILRALRWFDQVDPRDPLRLTEGVWAGLGRYYFLNNVNVWIWGLHGNNNLKGMEVIKTNTRFPEIGGRIQFPIPKGESGISVHRRIANSVGVSELIPEHENIGENRIGFDAKWDLTIGLWLEASWTTKNKDLGILTNQEILTLGSDYTFGIGSGLNLTLEHMMFAFDKNPFGFQNRNNFTAFSMNYPLGMFDNIQAIFYYNWENNSLYNFLNWYRQFDKTTFYIMGYWNPKDVFIPGMGMETGENLFGGVGLQLLMVFNH